LSGFAQGEEGNLKPSKCLWSLALLIPLAAHIAALPQSNPNSGGGVQDLAFFEGNYHCEGKFAANGKAINADLQFQKILDGKFQLFKHDDEPPFNYHAWSEWGWDAAGHQFVSTVQDSTGGLRLFHSKGWAGTRLEWTGGNLPDSQDQRFVFERLEDRSFRVSYSFQKNGSWVDVDSSVCRRVETK
jgi:hypothetical protein